MNRTLCLIVAVIIIAFAITLDVYLITSYSSTMFLTVSDRILLCIIWSVLLGGMTCGVWGCRAE